MATRKKRSKRTKNPATALARVIEEADYAILAGATEAEVVTAARAGAKRSKYRRPLWTYLD